MRKHSRSLALCLSALALALQGCATTTDGGVESTAQASAPAGPALWKLADEDTTIYLFGTVHALPEGLPWYSPRISVALQSSDTFVSEIISDETAEERYTSYISTFGVLPQGQTVRRMLTEEERAGFEALLARMGMMPGDFDPFEPWYPAIFLSVKSLEVLGGFDVDQGVEKKLLAELPEGIDHKELESIEAQLAMFDGLPPDVQLAYLKEVVAEADSAVEDMNRFVPLWLAGDERGMARLLGEMQGNEDVAQVLIYQRNEAWAQWIEQRLDTPGTVFVAVGAGHLAGERSVQDFLRKDGLRVRRVG